MADAAASNDADSKSHEINSEPAVLSKNQEEASSSQQSSKVKSKKKNTNSSLDSNYIRNCILFLCAIGMFISMYALYVEILKEKDPNYTAMCDVNSYMTCSRVLTSKYAKGFGLFSNESIFYQPNPVYGMAFYTFQASLVMRPAVPSALTMVITSVAANLGSVYLAYILIYVLKDACLVCISTYIVNAAMLLGNLAHLKRQADLEMRTQRRKQQ